MQSDWDGSIQVIGIQEVKKRVGAWDQGRSTEVVNWVDSGSSVARSDIAPIIPLG